MDQFATTLADAACSSYVQCGRVPDRSSCHLTAMSGSLLTLKTAVEANQVEFDGHMARQCVTAIVTALKDCPFNLAGPEAEAICASVFTGHGSSGAPCFVDQQCSSDLRCLQSDSSCDNECCAGICQAKPAPIALGESCNIEDACVAGSYCKIAGGTGICSTATTEAGIACSLAAACAPPLACVPDYLRGRTSFTFSCLRPTGTGGDCSDSSGNYCDDSRDRCDAAAGRCVRLPGAGSPCDPEMIHTCSDYARCDAQSGQCVARGKIGDGCDAVIGTGCIDTLVCDKSTATCQVPAATACMAM